ncbi:MAG: cytochrome C [Geobacteraceae bacterium]|nr:cytochrome C [Geobacteraceae bacterium]
MKKLLFGLMLFALSALYVQLAVAEKEPHKDYASLKIPECNACHKAEGIALNHDADWVRGHRVLAARGGAKCTECHDQAWCLDCHQGGGIDVGLSTQNYKRDYIPKSHRSDWLELHPLKALDNPQTCTRCHTEQKFCIQCHSRFKATDLQFQSHRRQFRDIKLSSVGPQHAIFEQNGVINTAVCQTCHPGGLVPTHTWSGEHAIEARRNLQACQTCHSDGDVCLTCHSARTGLKVNPHPRNWSAVKGNFKDKSNGRSCIRCHDTF